MKVREYNSYVDTYSQIKHKYFKSLIRKLLKHTPSKRGVSGVIAKFIMKSLSGVTPAMAMQFL